MRALRVSDSLDIAGGRADGVRGIDVGSFRLCLPGSFLDATTSC